MALARPPVVSQSEWDAALAAMTEREEAVGAALHELAAARKRMPMVRVERDYRFEGPDGRTFAARAVRRAQPAHPLPVLLRGGRRRLARRRVPRLLVRRRRHCRSRLRARPRHHLRHGVAGTAGEPAPLRRAHGLDRPALVHDPHRALLGRLRRRRVVRLQRLPARRRRRVPHLLPPARARWSRASAPSGACRPSRPTAASPRTRTCRRAGRKRPGRSGSAVTTSSTSRRRRPAPRPTTGRRSGSTFSRRSARPGCCDPCGRAARWRRRNWVVLGLCIGAWSRCLVVALYFGARPSSCKRRASQVDLHVRRLQRDPAEQRLRAHHATTIPSTPPSQLATACGGAGLVCDDSPTSGLGAGTIAGSGASQLPWGGTALRPDPGMQCV